MRVSDGAEYVSKRAAAPSIQRLELHPAPSSHSYVKCPFEHLSAPPACTVSSRLENYPGFHRDLTEPNRHSISTLPRYIDGSAISRGE